MRNVGTREDLLAAAKQCLAERGYARTTVRDIVAASGTNLAAINYHFGTRDKLLNQAMIESSTSAVNQVLEALPDTALEDPAARLDAFWRKLIESFSSNRGIWVANIESLAQALHSPELQAQIGAAQSEARATLAQLLGLSDQPDDALGAILQTLIGGLLAQWMVDPDHAPSPAELTAGLHALAAATAPR